MPEELDHMAPAIADEMKRYLFSGRVLNARDKEFVKYTKRVEMNPDFKDLWDKIKQKTRYKVKFENEELITRALVKIGVMPEIKPLALTIEKKEVKISEAGVESGRTLQMARDKTVLTHETLPDILAFLQRETDLTRGTLVEILKQCGRLKEFKLNPQAFMIEVAKQIKRTLQELIIAGIEYELIDDQYYEMHRFDQEDVERYLNRLYKVQHQTEGEGSSQVVRTPYDYVEFDSSGEEETAQALDEDENVRFFCKLPEWFKVQTPLGGYSPDWAIVTEDEGKLYLVRETKSTHDSDKRRKSENLKIKCGEAHFKELGVDFKVVINPRETIKGHSQEELL